MSELSPKEREFLESIRKEWGPSEETKDAVRGALPVALAAEPSLGLDGPGGPPGPAAPAAPALVATGLSKSAWVVGGLAVLGLCAAGLLWGRGGEQAPRAPLPAPDAVSAAPLVAPRPAEAPVPTAMQPSPMEAVSLDSLPNVAPPFGSATKTATAQPAPSGATDTLAEELALLRTAQTALRTGAPNDALAALSTHASRFPRGMLREERMTLQVLALCDRGDVTAARAAKAELERAAPGSSHLQRLASSCAGQ